jgi:hypothetical protein
MDYKKKYIKYKDKYMILKKLIGGNKEKLLECLNNIYDELEKDIIDVEKLKKNLDCILELRQNDDIIKKLSKGEQESITNEHIIKTLKEKLEQYIVFINNEFKASINIKIPEILKKIENMEKIIFAMPPLQLVYQKKIDIIKKNYDEVKDIFKNLFLNTFLGEGNIKIIEDNIKNIKTGDKNLIGFIVYCIDTLKKEKIKNKKILSDREITLFETSISKFDDIFKSDGPEIMDMIKLIEDISKILNILEKFKIIDEIKEEIETISDQNRTMSIDFFTIKDKHKKLLKKEELDDLQLKREKLRNYLQQYDKYINLYTVLNEIKEEFLTKLYEFNYSKESCYNLLDIKKYNLKKKQRIIEKSAVSQEFLPQVDDTLLSLGPSSDLSEHLSKEDENDDSEMWDDDSEMWDDDSEMWDDDSEMLYDGSEISEQERDISVVDISEHLSLSQISRKRIFDEYHRYMEREKDKEKNENNIKNELVCIIDPTQKPNIRIPFLRAVFGMSECLFEFNDFLYEREGSKQVIRNIMSFVDYLSFFIVRNVDKIKHLLPIFFNSSSYSHIIDIPPDGTIVDKWGNSESVIITPRRRNGIYIIFLIRFKLENIIIPCCLSLHPKLLTFHYCDDIYYPDTITNAHLREQNSHLLMNKAHKKGDIRILLTKIIKENGHSNLYELFYKLINKENNFFKDVTGYDIGLYPFFSDILYILSRIMLTP